MGYSGPCLEILIENLEREDHPVLQIMIRNITILYNEARPESVAHTLQELMSILKKVLLTFKSLKKNNIIQLFLHSNAEIRKSVVFCLVDLSFIFEEFIEKYMKEFTSSQKKLVHIYIEKRMEKSIIKS